LVEHLERARVQTTRARTIELLGGASLDDDHVDAGQRELGSEHQTGRTAADHHHRMRLVHAHLHVRGAHFQHTKGPCGKPPSSRYAGCRRGCYFWKRRAPSAAKSRMERITCSLATPPTPCQQTTLRTPASCSSSIFSMHP